MAQAIERRFATPVTSPRLPSNRPATRRSYGLATLCVLRRQLVLLVPIAALALAASSSAALRPIDRSFGEITTPRVRTGTIPVRKHSGRIVVIATFDLPPLAAAKGPGLFATLGPTR